VLADVGFDSSPDKSIRDCECALEAVCVSPSPAELDSEECSDGLDDSLRLWSSFVSLLSALRLYDPLPEPFEFSSSINHTEISMFMQYYQDCRDHRGW
jgi:hypothetical protein